jgi:hypothetical protein
MRNKKNCVDKIPKLYYNGSMKKMSEAAKAECLLGISNKPWITGTALLKSLAPHPVSLEKLPEREGVAGRSAITGLLEQMKEDDMVIETSAPMIHPMDPGNKQDAAAAKVANRIAERWWKNAGSAQSRVLTKELLEQHLNGWRSVPGNRPDMIILDDMEDPGPIGTVDMSRWYTKGMKIEIGGNKMNEVTITKVTNGFIIKVGCMTLVSKSWKEISSELEKFWKDPQGMQEKYEKIRDGKA